MTAAEKLSIAEQLAIRYGAWLTLDEAARYFGVGSAKAMGQMYENGNCPIPITELKRPGAKRNPRVVLVEHLAPYLEEMAVAAKRQYDHDYN